MRAGERRWRWSGLGAILVLGTACVGGGAGTSAGESDGDGDEPPPVDIAWVYDGDLCGHAYGVLHRGEDAIVVGSQDGSPWVIRLDPEGSPRWQVIDPSDGAFFAVDGDAASIWAVGRWQDEGEVRRGLVVGLDEEGASLQRLDAVAGEGAGLYGVVASAGADGGGLALTGVVDDHDLLAGVLDLEGGELDRWLAPGGDGKVASVGFGIDRAGDDGVVVCGRANSAGLGLAWLGRFDGAGDLAWDGLGPALAYDECWGVAVADDGVIARVGIGSTGGWISRSDPDGTLQWVRTEWGSGAQAVDVDPEGRVYVAGWSAFPEADPFRAADAMDGWIAAFDEDGARSWRLPLVPELSLHALRVDPEGWMTVVGTRELGAECPHPWIARIRPIAPS